MAFAVLFVVVVAVLIIAGFRNRAVREWIVTRGAGLTFYGSRGRAVRRRD